MQYVKYVLLLALPTCSMLAMHKPVDPNKLIPLLMQALHQNQFRQAAGFLAHFRIRSRLDVACCTDKSTRAVGDILTIMGMTNPKFQELSQQVPKEDFEAIFHQELATVERDLEDKKLSSPHWVAQYGMNQFGMSTSEKPLFPSDEECYKIRRSTLDEYKKVLPKPTWASKDSCVLL